jgi:hypothetical protein
VRFALYSWPPSRSKESRLFLSLNIHKILNVCEIFDATCSVARLYSVVREIRGSNLLCVTVIFHDF